MDRTYGFAAVAVACCLAGCAGVTAGPVSDDKADMADQGFRYYETAPFLLLYTDSKGGLKSEVLYLPDTTKLRSVRPYAWGATNNTALSFENGRLVKSSSEVDTAVIPKAVIAGLEKIATKAAAAANAGSDGIPGPYLFRIHKKGDVWSLEGAIAKGTDGTTDSFIRYTKP